MSPLLQHLQQCHNKLVPVNVLTFATHSAFLEWKEDEEVRSFSRFVQRNKGRHGSEATVYYFYCNRSGFYTPRGNSKRSLKAQGSSKLNCYCTAHIKAIVMPNGNVTVHYCSTHHNHKPDIAHLALPRHVRQLIATKIQQGVSVDRILDDVRDSIAYGENPRREHLTNTRDILNIKKELNVLNVQKHLSDPISLDIWVKQLQDSSDIYNAVLYYKQQGEEDPTDRLQQDDILVCIQTEFQLDMLQKFGNNVICMDATHGTNQYNFILITVLVLDELGEGIPVAWAISNRETELSLAIFLESVQMKASNIKPLIFMSDDAVQYWSAWKSVYGTNSTKKLLCSWHVDRSWRNALTRYIDESSVRAEIYAKLRVVMTETSQDKLPEMIQQLMSFLSAEHSQFADYLRENYLNRLAQWCYAHRVGTLVNTNMHVEAFHRVLKYTYLHGKQNKRLDSLLCALLKIARDKWFERIQKTTKGKTTHRMRELNNRHTKAVEIQNSYVVQSLTDSSWNVSSDTSDNYVIRTLLLECSCSLHCIQCDVCPHMLSCSCIDYAVHSTACKHIHLICIKHLYTPTPQRAHFSIVSTSTPQDSTSCEHHSIQHSELQPTTPPEQCLPQQSEHQSPPSEQSQQQSLAQSEHHAQPESSSRLSSIELIRRKLISEACSIQLMATSSQSESALKAAVDHLVSARLILNSQQDIRARESASLTIPPNKKIATQRYKSTKKKRVTSKSNSMSKPTNEEIKRIKLDMSSTLIRTCASCYREEPPLPLHQDSSTDVIEWIECSNCPLWFHQLCVKDSLHCNGELMCHICQKH